MACLGMFTLQASVGPMSSEPSGSNGSYDLTVVPLELMGFVDVAYGLRIGAGCASLRQSCVARAWSPIRWSTALSLKIQAHVG